jgi:hypothetical protein
MKFLLYAEALCSGDSALGTADSALGTEDSALCTGVSALETLHKERSCTKETLHSAISSLHQKEYHINL